MIVHFQPFHLWICTHKRTYIGFLATTPTPPLETPKNALNLQKPTSPSLSILIYSRSEDNSDQIPNHFTPTPTHLLVLIRNPKCRDHFHTSKRSRGLTLQTLPLATVLSSANQPGSSHLYAGDVLSCNAYLMAGLRVLLRCCTRKTVDAVKGDMVSECVMKLFDCICG